MIIYVCIYLFICLYIYIYIYLFLFIYFVCALVYFIFIFALCGLGLYKFSLEVFTPHMIFHCKYLAISFLLVYTKICKNHVKE